MNTLQIVLDRKVSLQKKSVFQKKFLFSLYKYTMTNICIERQIQQVLSQKNRNVTIPSNCNFFLQREIALSPPPPSPRPAA